MCGLVPSHHINHGLYIEADNLLCARSPSKSALGTGSEACS